MFLYIFCLFPEPPFGFGPKTYCLQNSCSTVELRRLYLFLILHIILLFTKSAAADSTVELRRQTAWVERDSNPRSPRTRDLQSRAFDRSAIHPSFKNFYILLSNFLSIATIFYQHILYELSHEAFYIFYFP
jgi:hypothetical protein